MAGNTATIIIEQFRRAWDEHVPIRLLCTMFTVSRDQVTRLKFIWGLSPRHDRRLRRKPSRDERFPEPTAEELASSEASLNLSPLVAQRVTCVQVNWTDEVRAERQVVKPTAFRLSPVDTPAELSDAIDEVEREW